jgi:type I restriction enzyme S subunit
MNNYHRTPFTEIATLIRGVSYDKSVVSTSEQEGCIPILRANNIQNSLVLNDLVYVPNDFVKEEQMIREGDIVLAMSSGSKDLVGKSAQANNDINAAFGTFCGLIRAKEKVDSKYLGLYFQTQEYRNFVSYQSKGVNICNLKKKDIESLQIPLPPLPTQHQIVSRIESLFAELDKAEEHLRTARQQLKTYKQAVLNHWLNNEDGKWETVKLGEVAEKIFDGPFGTHLKSDDYVADGIRVVRLENIKAGFFDDSKQSFVTEEKYETIKRHTVYPSDLIMSTFIAEEVKVCQMPEYIGFAVNKADCIGIRLKPEISVDYIKYYLSLRSVYHELEIQVHGATRPRVNTTQIKNIKISLPPLSDQQRIVDEIETRLSQAEAAEVRIAESLQKTEALRQSILKKAFSGELVQVDL